MKGETLFVSLGSLIFSDQSVPFVEETAVQSILPVFER
jgi:hypothetical protein